MKEPRQSIDRVAEWCNLPFELADGWSALGTQVPKFLRFDLPIDVAVSLVDEQHATTQPLPLPEPEASTQSNTDAIEGEVAPTPPEPSLVHAVVSIGVDNPDALVGALKKEGLTVEAAASDAYFVELDEELKCRIGPSQGLTSHRMTCAPSVEDLDALEGYAQAGLAIHPFPDKAFYGEIYFGPLRARYGNDVRQLKTELPKLLQEAHLGNARFDRALEEAANAISDEVIAWANDADTWNFSAEFQAQGETLVGASTFRFAKNTSYVANLLQRAAAEQKPAPQLFWDLPKEVDSASFNTRTRVTASEQKIAANLTELLAGGLEHLGAATGAADVWLESFRGLLESGGTVVVGSGSSPQPTKSAATKPAKVKTAQAVFDAFGYYLVGVEGDAGAFARALRSSVAAFNDKRLRTTLAKKLEEDLSKLPLVRARTLAKSNTAPAIELFSLSFPIPKSELPKNFTSGLFSMHLAMTSVGERTWLAFAFSEAEATTIVRKLVDGGDYAKLATREGLTSLRDRAMVQGSFFTLNSYAKNVGRHPHGHGRTPHRRRSGARHATGRRYPERVHIERRSGRPNADRILGNPAKRVRRWQCPDGRAPRRVWLGVLGVVRANDLMPRAFALTLPLLGTALLGLQFLTP